MPTPPIPPAHRPSRTTVDQGRPRRFVRRALGYVLCSAVMASALPVLAAAQSQLVWEDEYGSGVTPAPITIDGTTVSISGLDPLGIGSAGNFTVSYTTRGSHFGFWEAGFDAPARGDGVTMSLTFSRQVQFLEFTILDVDTNDQFHDSINVVGWNGNTPYAPTTTFVGANVAEVGPGVYSGLSNVGNTSTAANVAVVFGQPTDSVTFVYEAGPRAFPNPDLGIIGISDLTWTLPCIPTVTVSTMPELRAAAADPCVTTILIAPGVYDVTSDGGGQLVLDQDKVLRNTGGGEAILDGAGASRVVDLDPGATVELDGLTIRNGSAGRGAGIFTWADALTVRNTTIEANAANRGAGLFHRGGTLLLENVTVSGNTANVEGGGLDLRAGATLVHVTVASNSAGRSGGFRSRSGSVTLVNTVVADNVAAPNPQIRGTITSVGVNLVEGGCAGCLGTDLTGDPGLLPLASNGGDSRTHELGAGSIAIDAADAAFGLPTDQRGSGRPAGPGYDIGAYEAQPGYGVTVTAAVAGVDRLPSNGTAYDEAFTVTNPGPTAASYVLIGASTGSAVVIDSIRGAGVTFGARADSAATGVLAAGASQAVSVFYTVTDVAAGTTDPVSLTAAPAAAPGVTDADATTVTVVRPLLGMTKLATVAGDTVPGSAVTYQMTVTNLGTEAAAQVELLDSLPALVDYVVGSTTETLPAGITATLAFDDGTDTWTYTPVSQGCGAGTGLDRCVRAIRWILTAPLPSTAPDNVAVFGFTAGIR